jgi:hypothetical protein
MACMRMRGRKECMEVPMRTMPGSEGSECEVDGG